ncbi:hypothetical protein MMC14_000013 [Varicellaria rhodocarpa]|nr:hypothetical protein [Varicellaria rhodocarpa]
MAPTPLSKIPGLLLNAASSANPYSDAAPASLPAPSPPKEAPIPPEIPKTSPPPPRGSPRTRTEANTAAHLNEESLGLREWTCDRNGRRSRRPPRYLFEYTVPEGKGVYTMQREEIPSECVQQ